LLTTSSKKRSSANGADAVTRHAAVEPANSASAFRVDVVIDVENLAPKRAFLIEETRDGVETLPVFADTRKTGTPGNWLRNEIGDFVNSGGIQFVNAIESTASASSSCFLKIYAALGENPEPDSFENLQAMTGLDRTPYGATEKASAVQILERCTTVATKSVQTADGLCEDNVRMLGRSSEPTYSTGRRTCSRNTRRRLLDWETLFAQRMRVDESWA